MLVSADILVFWGGVFLFKIVGLTRVNYTSRDNRPVSGWRFHLTEAGIVGTNEQPVFGEQVEQAYFSDERLCQPFNRDLLAKLSQPAKLIGQYLDIRYNRYGSIDSGSIVVVD